MFENEKRNGDTARLPDGATADARRPQRKRGLRSAEKRGAKGEGARPAVETSSTKGAGLRRLTPLEPPTTVPL